MGLDSFLHYPLKEIPFIFVALVIAFTLHEFAHAYTAYKFGDPTAYNQGRVTLNPRAHIDILGTILIFIAGFGWARPVPVNRGKFKYPRLMGIAVSIAGPISNLLIAFVGLMIAYAFAKFGWGTDWSVGSRDALKLFLLRLIELNLTLFLFNLIPLPPLDGYRVVEDLLPLHLRLKIREYEQWAIYIFLLMVFIPPIARVTLGPIFSLQIPIYESMNELLAAWFHFDFSWAKFLR